MCGCLYISVIGPGVCSAVEYEQAYEVGALVASQGAVLVCGGLGGVMEAAARGAREAGGSTLGLLPGSDRTIANPFLDHALPTGLGEARNLVVVAAADAVIAVGGSPGTLSEMGLAAKLGRPVVVLDGWRVTDASSSQEGVAPGGETPPFSYAASATHAVALAYAALDSAAHREMPAGD